MIEERYVELINKELDGLNTESESQELEKYLSENVEALTYYEDLLRTASALKHAEEIQPPSYLKTHILNSIKFDQPLNASRFAWIDGVMEVFRQRPFPKYALVFAAGLCVGILIFIFGTPSHQEEGPEVSKLTGSMILLSDLSHLQKIDSVSVKREGLQGTFKTFKSEGKILVDFSVTSPEDIRLELSADQEELTFVGVSRINGSANDVIATGGRVIFTGIKSDHSIVTYSEAAAPQNALDCRILKGGTVVQSISLRTHD